MSFDTVQTSTKPLRTLQKGRPKKHENRKAVTVYLSEAEYKWVELQAGGNVSEWCREQMLAEYPGSHAEAVPQESGPKVESKPPKKEPVRQKCRHGLFYCATCLELDAH